MGFEVVRNVTLEFEGYMQGAEVTLRAASIGTMLALRDMTPQAAVPLLAGHLVNWNLEANGEPLPLTEDSCNSLEAEMLYKIVGEWYRVATGVSAPLDPPSTDGPESPATEVEELSLPMDIL